MSLDDVETRIRATLFAVAETTEYPVEPRIVPVGELDEPTPGRQRRRSFAFAAATVVALCVAGSIAVVATHRDGVALDTRAALDVPRAEWRTTTAPVVAPTWLPPQLHLYQLDSRPANNSATGSDLTLQLFGSTDRNGRIIAGLALGTRQVMGVGILGTSVRVRGHDARIDPQSGGASLLSWIDSDKFEMFATFKGLTLQHAIAVIDALRPRSERPLDGFDPSSLPGDLRVLGQSLAGPRSTLSADLRYAPALTGNDLGLTGFIVRTTTAGDTSQYLQALLSGQVGADGSVELDSFSNVEHGDSGTTRQPIVRIMWPDGRSIEVNGGFGIDIATLRRIARSARPFDASQVERLRSEIDVRLGLLPVWASTTVDRFVLELRGRTQPLAACLRIGTQTPVCAELQGAEGPAVGQVLVAGQWIAFVAQQVAPTFDVTGAGAEVHKAEARGWHFAFVLLGKHATELDVSGVWSVTRPTE